MGHPYPQPHLGRPDQETSGDTTTVKTCEGIFPPCDPFSHPPGTNLLPTVHTNIFDSCGSEVINTLPSTPREPYHLHDGEPRVSRINGISPTDDLTEIFNRLPALITVMPGREHWAEYGNCTGSGVGQPLPGDEIPADEVRAQLGRAIDILEGTPIPDRVYGGFPLLHYNGPKKKKTVRPVRDDTGKIVGGNVDVHQIWYDSHIESDTAFLDLTKLVDENGKVSDKIPWTITSTMDVLSRGKDDFAPMTMYFDHPDHQPPPRDCAGNIIQEDGGQRQYRLKLGSSEEEEKEPPLPNVAMDQTFFPIQEGTRTVLRLKMAPPAYYDLTYTWGWRQHPPRVQVIENAGKEFPPTKMDGRDPKPLFCYELEVFDRPKDEAIGKLSDLAPAKRMWTAFRAALAAAGTGNRDAAECRQSSAASSNLEETDNPDFTECLRQLKAAWCAFHEWKDRNQLPSGVCVDPGTDLTLLYVNNTIYGQLSDGGRVDFPKWRTRKTQLKVTLLNGDYFEHAYLNIDFGGARGWENQFKSSLKEGGSGCLFSFGRFYWSINMAKAVILPAAARDGAGTTVPSRHNVFITYNFEPSRRLRFYQFDPMHHDVAVYSLH